MTRGCSTDEQANPKRVRVKAQVEYIAAGKKKYYNNSTSHATAVIFLWLMFGHKFVLTSDNLPHVAISHLLRGGAVW